MTAMIISLDKEAYSLYIFFIHSFRCVDIPSCFSAILQRETTFDFLLASLDNETIPKWGQLLQERVCSYGSDFFPLNIDLH